MFRFYSLDFDKYKVKHYYFVFSTIFLLLGHYTYTYIHAYMLI